MLLLPALVIYLGLNAGGYFADTTGWAAAAMALALGARLLIDPRGPSAFGRPLIVAAAGLALYGLWTLLSGEWSGNWGRSLIEFDRALLYLLVLLVFGSIAEPRKALRFLPLGFAAAGLVLCAVGLATRTIPDVWPFEFPEPRSRLSYPVTYSNGLGALAALSLVFCVHIASWERHAVALRIAAVAAAPLLAATLALTFSRGATLAALLGAAVYIAVARPRGLPLGLVSIGLPSALAGAFAYNAELLTSRNPATDAAIQQGHDVLGVVALATLGAIALFAALLPLERRFAHVKLPAPPRRALIAGGVVAAVVAIAAAAVLVPDAIDGDSSEIGTEADDRDGDESAQDRFSSAAISGAGQTRLEYWEVSLGSFEREPLIGTGVGTFAHRWALERPFPESVTEGHSLYLETLGELGVVGAALILFVLLMMAAPFVRARDLERPLRAVALAAFAAWAVHTGIDWDWELPVLSAWVFAFAGCGLALLDRRPAGRLASGPARVSAMAACVLVAVTPVAVALSQSRLDRSVAALERGDCDEAIDLAASARSAVPVRSEPYEVLAYCYSRAGSSEAALASMHDAIDRDPDDWRLYYGLALVQAAAGEDPRPAVATARRLNPLEPLVKDAAELFDGEDAEAWQRQARQAPLPL